MNGLLKTIFLLKLSYQVKALSPTRTAQSSVSLIPEQLMVRVVFPSVVNTWPFQDNLLSITVSSKGLSLGRPEQ